MRIGKINWTSHSNLPILSVDVQPNGYRFITGGSDNNVCVWNLLPVISEKYEMLRQPKVQEDKSNLANGINRAENGEESKAYNPNKY
jgi:WD40 repeat protein